MAVTGGGGLLGTRWKVGDVHRKVGTAWCCLEQAGELDGVLQTCSEVGKMIEASSWRSEATGVLLGTVRFSRDG